MTRSTFWRACFDSRHFSFEAYGLTEGEALTALRRTLADHAKQYHVTTDDWFHDDDLFAYEITIGSGLRDRSPIRL